MKNVSEKLGRCVICGRFFSWEKLESGDVVDVAFEGVCDLDPAEPQMAHKECAGK